MVNKRCEDHVAALAGLLTSPIRIAIVDQLLKGPCIVGDLVTAVGTEQAVISKQIGILRNAGLLVCQPNGRNRTYSLYDSESVERLMTTLRETAQKASIQAAVCKKAAKQKRQE